MDLVNAAPGQCRLEYDSATALKLVRKDGAFLPLKISGTWQAKLIPSTPPTLSNAGLTAATRYYVYAFDNAGTLTLEASTTGYASDTDVGVSVKTGDPSRTLVGQAYMGPGSPGTFVDSDTQAFVLSYFNRRSRGLVNGFTANRTTTSTTYAEINTEIRVEFLTWPDEAVDVAISGSGQHSVTGIVATSVAFDGATAEDAMTAVQAFVATATLPYALALKKRGLAEGYHFATLVGRTDAATTATWYGGAVGTGGGASGRTSLTALVRG